MVAEYGASVGEDLFVKIKGLITDMIAKLEKEADHPWPGQGCFHLKLFTLGQAKDAFFISVQKLFCSCLCLCVCVVVLCMLCIVLCLLCVCSVQSVCLSGVEGWRYG